jgi:hypothetical protein
MPGTSAPILKLYEATEKKRKDQDIAVTGVTPALRFRKSDNEMVIPLGVSTRNHLKAVCYKYPSAEFEAAAGCVAEMQYFDKAADWDIKGTMSV